MNIKDKVIIPVCKAIMQSIVGSWPWLEEATGYLFWVEQSGIK